MSDKKELREDEAFRLDLGSVQAECRDNPTPVLIARLPGRMTFSLNGSPGAAATDHGDTPLSCHNRIPGPIGASADSSSCIFHFARDSETLRSTRTPRISPGSLEKLDFRLMG